MDGVGDDGEDHSGELHTGEDHAREPYDEVDYTGETMAESDFESLDGESHSGESHDEEAHDGAVHDRESMTENPTMEKTMPKFPREDHVTGTIQMSDDTRRKDGEDMLDYSWSSLGGCSEIAGASDAVWLITLDISERCSGDGHLPQDLSLLWLGKA